MQPYPKTKNREDVRTVPPTHSQNTVYGSAAWAWWFLLQYSFSSNRGSRKFKWLYNCWKVTTIETSHFLNEPWYGRKARCFTFLLVSFLCFVHVWLLASHRQLHWLRFLLGNWTLQVKDYIKIRVPNFGWLHLKNIIFDERLFFLKVFGLAGWSVLFLPKFHHQQSWWLFPARFVSQGDGLLNVYGLSHEGCMGRTDAIYTHFYIHLHDMVDFFWWNLRFKYIMFMNLTVLIIVTTLFF